MAFVTGIGQSEYDADAQRLRLIVDGAMTDNGKLIVRLADNTKERPYAASNAFGAQITVSELRGERFGLSVVNTGDIRESGCSFGLHWIRRPRRP